MSANEIELQPDTAEVLQVESPAGYEPTVKVCVEEVKSPVRTQALPRKAGATFTQNVAAMATPGSATQILRADHRRAGAVIMSIGQDMRIAFTEAATQDAARMALWPARVPFPVTTATEVWVASETGTTSVSVATELWATGDGE